MSASLTISVPDRVLARLQKRAAEMGTTAEAIAADELEASTVPEGYGKLRRRVGAISFSESDIAGRHYELLGEALAAELRGRRNV